jgi:Concanavalin A-like lectin/glucanases superfamily/IPT/TIG domain
MKRTLRISIMAAMASLTLPILGQDGMLGLTTINSFVSVPSAPALTPQTGLTVEAWFYINPAAPGGNDNPTIVRKDPGSFSYLLRTDQGSGGTMQWGVWTQSGGITGAQTPSPVPTLSWHHAAGTYDGAMMRLYLDGVQVVALPKTGSLLTTTGALQIGTGDATDETWKGNIDEVRIWSVARSASQIQATMLQRLDSAPGLVAAWHFDGNFQDLTGGHHGTPMSGAVVVPSTSPVHGVILTAPAISPIGGPLTFQVYSSPGPAPYLLEISLSGTMPGTPLPPPGTGVFPLNPPFIYSTYGGGFPYTFQGFAGVTNASGFAFPVLNVHANPLLTGLVISSAFVILDGSAPLGIGKISNAAQTTITGYGPVISGIAPPTGPTAGGWAVTISGDHFLPGATVSFGGVPATSVTVASNSITCFTPAGPLGPVNVVVQNPDGNQTTAVGGFTYVATLAVTAANPIVAAPGASVQVTGGGFTPGLVASLGGVPVTVGTVLPTSFQFTAPQGTFCSAPLVVTLPDTQSATLNGVNPAPTITNVIGPPGVPSGGSSFFILGTSFHPGTTVTVGGAPAAIVSLSTTAILATAPPGTTGPAQLLVTSAAGCGATSVYFYQ